MHHSHLRRRELWSTFLRAEYLHKLFEVPIYLVICISMNSRILKNTLSYNPINPFLFIFLLKIFRLWPLGILSIGPLSV